MYPTLGELSEIRDGLADLVNTFGPRMPIHVRFRAMKILHKIVPEVDFLERVQEAVFAEFAVEKDGQRVVPAERAAEVLAASNAVLAERSESADWRDLEKRFTEAEIKAVQPLPYEQQKLNEIAARLTRMIAWDHSGEKGGQS